MKVFIFSHKSDIDGMGSVVLANLAFENVSYKLCEAFSIDEDILKTISSKKLYEFDLIFVCDLCPSEKVIKQISKDIFLNDKFFVFDHHETMLEQVGNKFEFVTVKIKNEKGLCSGTSLFYEYLVDKKFISPHPAVDKFVELTRKYDTWEWKNIYGDNEPRKLSVLFDCLGCENYIHELIKKLRNKNINSFEFDDTWEMIVSNKLSQIETIANESVKNVFFKDVLGYQAVIAFIDYEYRNEVAEKIKATFADKDFSMLIAMNHTSISFRCINENVNVRVIAEHFGGKGHDKASSCSIDNKTLQKIIDLLLL